MASVFENLGLLINEENYKLAKKQGKKGDRIQKHNHPEANVIFTVVKGKIEVKIDDESFILEAGKVLTFDGNSYISAEMLEDSQAFVTLINKK